MFVHQFFLKILPLLLLCSLAPQFAMAREIHVSPQGKDSQDGSPQSPYRTLSKATKGLKAGDVVVLHEGRYREGLLLRNLKGTAEKPIVIKAAPNAEVVLDGTDPLENLQWQEYQDGIYRVRLDQPISQLFQHQKMLTPARWPNAHMTDANFFNKRETLRSVSRDSRFGYIIDEDVSNARKPYNKILQPMRESRKNKLSLAASGMDATGCVALMNIGSWQNYASYVKRHQPGQAKFFYDKTFKDSGDMAEMAKKLGPDGRFANMLEGKYWHNHNYMLEGLACLDVAREYWYDHKSRFLYLKPDGGKINTGGYAGKRRSYMLEARNSTHLHVKGIDFHASTFKFFHCTNSSISHADLQYASHNEFQLGNLGEFPVARIMNQHSNTTDKLTGNAVRHCTFRYIDGPALRISGRDTLVENCLFHDIQYSCLGFGWALMLDKAVVRRCTLYRSGAAQGFRSGRVLAYNHVYNVGGLQHDGSCFQASGRDQVIFRYNWAHDVYDKLPYRLDVGAYPKEPNAYGQIYGNAAWRCGEYQIKGDHHLIANNLAFFGSQIGLSTVKKYKSTNHKTICWNNIATDIVGSGKDPVPGDLQHNLITDAPENLLRAPHCGDFRPIKDGDADGRGRAIGTDQLPPGFPKAWLDPKALTEPLPIGPALGNQEHYIIPGYQSDAAQTPVPFDQAVDVPLRDSALMFLPALNAKQSNIYYSTDRKAVEASQPKVRVACLQEQANVASLPSLDAGQTYFWRVNTEGADGETVSGPIWSFTAKK